MFEWFEAWPSGALTLAEVLSSAATAAAAVLAWITIRQAKRQARAAQEALLHERRVDHLLDLLMFIATENFKASNVAWVDPGIAVRARMLPMDLVPITRAAMGIEAPESARRQVSELRQPGLTARETARQLIDAEVASAIDALVASRPGGIKSVSGAAK